MLFRDKSIVPSIMFHTAGLENSDWVWSYISEPVDLFEEKVKKLDQKGFNAVNWDELYACMSGEHELRQDSIFLTFDDGYLDNWVFIYPILKKYGMKGTIFVNPDFVDPRDIVRPNLEDVWAGRATYEELETAGFLSWPEMRLMESSGVIDIQSHSLTHTWYFSGPKIVDYHRPRSIEQYPWLAWNQQPDRKPFYLAEDQSGFVDYGSPIFEHEKSLIVKRFFPDDDAVNKIRDYIVEQGVGEFFKTIHWNYSLQEKIDSWFGGKVPGRYETEEEHLQRIRYELSHSRYLIEKNLNKEIKYICWPGGGNDEKVWEIARDVGYKSWTLGSQDKSHYRNVFNSNPEFIKRMGSSNQVRIHSRVVGTGRSVYMMLRIGAHQNSVVYKYLLRFYQLYHYIVSRISNG